MQKKPVKTIANIDRAIRPKVLFSDSVALGEHLTELHRTVRAVHALRGFARTGRKGGRK
jgi:hypothetical protein